MKTVFLLFIGLVITALVAGCVRSSTAVGRNTEATRQQAILPQLPADTTELKFSEFFVTPVGPRGLALTEKLAKLNGQRVRMLGYMVGQESGLPGKFLFTAIPIALHDHDSSDDLPPAVVHVSVPTCRDKQVPHFSGLMLLTGTLSVGHHEEADGRISVVRLALDPPARNERPASFFGSKRRSTDSSPRSSAR